MLLEERFEAYIVSDFHNISGFEYEALDGLF